MTPSLYESAVPGIKEQAQLDMLKLFGQCEQALNPGLVGKTITAADYYLLMLASWYPPNARALYQRYPKLAALAKTVMARPAAVEVLGEAA